MANSIVDLWPENIGVAEDIVSPASVLREQAALLGQKTKNLVQADVQALQNVNGKDFNGRDIDFVFSFYLVAPAMSNYKFLLFHVVHPLEFYPLRFHCEYVAPDPEDIHSQDELIRKLREVFAAEKTVRVIKAILAQSKE